MEDASSEMSNAASVRSTSHLMQSSSKSSRTTRSSRSTKSSQSKRRKPLQLRLISRKLPADTLGDFATVSSGHRTDESLCKKDTLEEFTKLRATSTSTNSSRIPEIPRDTVKAGATVMFEHTMISSEPPETVASEVNDSHMDIYDQYYEHTLNQFDTLASSPSHSSPRTASSHMQTLYEHTDSSELNEPDLDASLTTLRVPRVKLNLRMIPEGLEETTETPAASDVSLYRPAFFDATYRSVGAYDARAAMGVDREEKDFRRMFNHGDSVPNSQELDVPADEFAVLRYTPLLEAHRLPAKFKCRVQKRQCEVTNLIGCTMYNEAWPQVFGTLRAIAANVRTFVYAQGADAWQRHAVMLIVDGMEHFDEEVRARLTLLGAFDEDMLVTEVQDRSVKAHLFEVAVEFEESLNSGQYMPPMNLILLIKTHNAGKLDSHLWMFGAMAKRLNPREVTLVDVGTLPKAPAIYRLHDALEADKNCAGVCGEIVTDSTNPLDPVVAAQVYEYKISHILDKALESSVGYLSVLPGAFSMYRWAALRDSFVSGPLRQYFSQLETPPHRVTPFKANLFLAEDRVLCTELMCLPGKKYTMKWVSDSVATTDIPKDLYSLMRQRRRWVNGSFFALLYNLSRFSRFWKKSAHSAWHKAVMTCFFGYQLTVVVMSWFLLANTFLAFWFVVHERLRTYDELPLWIVWMPLGLYLVLLLAQVLYALGGPRNMERSSAVHKSSAWLFGGLMVVFLLMTVLYVVEKSKEDNATSSFDFLALTIGIGAVVGIPFLAAFLHGAFMRLLLAFPAYWIMLPAWTNMLQIFAFAQLHDISWGNRPNASARNLLIVSVAQEQAEQQAEQVPDSSATASSAVDGKVRARTTEELSDREAARMDPYLHVPNARAISTEAAPGDALHVNYMGQPRNFGALYEEAKNRDEIALEEMRRVAEREKSVLAAAKREERLRAQLVRAIDLNKLADNFEDTFRSFRTQVVWAWVLSNVLLAGIVLAIPSSVSSDGYLLLLLCAIALVNFVKFTGSVVYAMGRVCRRGGRARRMRRQRKQLRRQRRRHQHASRSRIGDIDDAADKSNNNNENDDNVADTADRTLDVDTTVAPLRIAEERN
ncbi:MAG: hypothetical protein MHM6MM_000968 [Cercozoa sp. M6MM]